jgi:hypothetical protein
MPAGIEATSLGGGIVKRSFILATLALSLSASFAGGAQAQGIAADLMPAYEVSTIVASLGMRPLGRPAWRAGRYIVAAVDRHGREVNVVLDARDGQVIAVRPIAGGFGPQRSGYDTGYAPPPPPGYPGQGPAPYDPRAGAASPRPPGAIPDAPPSPDGDDEFFDNDRQQGTLPPPPAAPRSASAPRELPTGSVPRRVTSLSPKDSGTKDATPMPRPRPALARANQPKPNDAKPEAAKPEAVKPEAAKPEAVKPKPQAAAPELAGDTTRKNARIIDLSKPEAKADPKPLEAIRF